MWVNKNLEVKCIFSSTHLTHLLYSELLQHKASTVRKQYLIGTNQEKRQAFSSCRGTVGHTILGRSSVHRKRRVDTEKKGEEKTGKQQKGNTVKHEAERETACERIRKRRLKERHLMSHVLKKKESFSCSILKRSRVPFWGRRGTSWLALPFLWLCLQLVLTSRMSEEGAAHTLSPSHAETKTLNLAGCTQTGGQMQLQAPTDTDEKRVSTEMTANFKKN